jgi:hypothetical protein
VTQRNDSVFLRAFVAHINGQMVSYVAVWKQLHLNQLFTKTRPKKWRATMAPGRGDEDTRKFSNVTVTSKRKWLLVFVLT